MKALEALADAIHGLVKETGRITTMVERHLAADKRYAHRQRAVRAHQVTVSTAELTRGKTVDVTKLTGGIPALGVTLIDDGGATAITWGANGEQPFTALEGDSLDQETIALLFVKGTAGADPLRVRFLVGEC